MIYIYSLLVSKVCVVSYKNASISEEVLEARIAEWKKRTFEKHIFVKMGSFSLITFFLSNSQLRSKIKKMRLNVTHTMIVSSDPGGPGTIPLKFIFENFHRKNDF